MAIVARGLGLPEDGALVVGGLGVSEADLNAMFATLAGSSSLSATLTAAGSVTPPQFTNSGGSSGVRLFRRTPAFVSAQLTGGSSVRAVVSFETNFDDSDLELLLLLELV